MAEDEVKAFGTVEDAFEWLFNDVDDTCIDNDRFAFTDDEAAMVEYQQKVNDGCCGSVDCFVLIDGREGIIGCNFGH